MMTVLTGIWIAVASAAIITWVVAMIASYREDDTVHLAAGEEMQIDRQLRNETRMKAIERWRMALSLSTVIGGVLVLGLYIYQGLA
jgi:hypothetical protein